MKVADFYNIVDQPNNRSSHSEPVIRGGGIVFVFGLLLWSGFNQFAFPYLIISVLGAAGISFMDDIKDIPSIYRFGVQFMSAVFLLFQFEAVHLSWYLLPLLILIIGIQNVFNFMDGINGLTGFYSLSVFLPFLCTEKNDLLIELFFVLCISTVVFLFYNARKKAKCFAGDIGSISISLMVIFVIFQRILKTDNYIYIFTLVVYGVDSGITILQRLVKRENIFAAHRKHLYQYLVNEFKFPHIHVSLTYGFLQLIFNLFLVFMMPSFVTLTFVAIVFVLLYILLKYLLYNKYNENLKNL
jgi:UDP-N-acetylmuramyl pentapeptide phosphotransferase/UDP-N-acetylglucosamine-1-phosphate transferase